MNTSNYCGRVIVVLGGMIPIGTRFKGLVQSPKQPNKKPLETKKNDVFKVGMRDICSTTKYSLPTYLPTCVNFRYKYPFVEGRSSFS